MGVTLSISGSIVRSEPNLIGTVRCFSFNSIGPEDQLIQLPLAPTTVDQAVPVLDGVTPAHFIYVETDAPILIRLNGTTQTQFNLQGDPTPGGAFFMIGSVSSVYLSNQNTLTAANVTIILGG